MLEIVLGGAGCGKTYYARNAAKTAALSGERPVLIVPEQFSFESERAMLELLGPEHGGLVKVLSFSRLADLFREKAGRNALPQLDGSGRAAAMCAALNGVGSSLELYKSSNSSAYINHMLDAVKEFKLYAVTPGMLSEASKMTGGTLSRKLNDFSLVFAAYDAVIDGCAADPLDSLSRLADALAEDPFFEGRTVVIDSFTTFTGQEFRVIDRIIAQSERCVVTLCAESLNAPEDGLFAPSVRTANRLREIAEAHSRRIAPPVSLAKRYRFVSPALAVAESSVFRYDEERLRYDEPADDITVYKASDIVDEAEFCARECRRLLREEGYRCRDIAVISRNEESYGVLIEDAMEQQGLPCFADKRINASCGAPMQLVSAALDCAVNGITADRLIRLLKTGLVYGAEDDDISELENYCFVWSVRDRELLSPFIQSPDGLERTANDWESRLGAINALREMTVGLIRTLAERLVGATGTEMAGAVYHFLEDCGAAKALEKKAARMSPSLRDEQEQLWKALMRLLDQIVTIIGGRKISPAEYKSLMDIMIDNCDIGRIPSGLDEITFGGAERIRVSAPKAVFILGMSDGVFPAVPSGSGIFSDEERGTLTKLGLAIADDTENELLNERLLAYRTMFAASRRLYAVYPSGAGGAQPSECIDELLGCVPKARVTEYDQSLRLENIEAPGAALELAARSWFSADTVSDALKYALLTGTEAKERLSVLAEEGAQLPPEIRSSDAARALFGNSIVLSASKLDTLYTCRFKFLCRYGLNLKEKKKARLDSPGYGLAAHYVLERVFCEHKDKPMEELADFDRVMVLVAEKLDEYLEKTLVGSGADPEKEHPELVHMIKRMRIPLTYLVVNIASELSSGDFLPQYFEYELDSGDSPVSAGSGGDYTVRVNGKIDRVDCCEIDGKNYVRVIDYKTGTKKFRLSDVLCGLDMQMLVYLSFLSEKNAEDIPAGILYCPALPPVTDGAGDKTRDDVINDNKGALKRKGLIIDDKETLSVAKAMEKGLEHNYLPVALTSKNQLNKHCEDFIISAESYDTVRRYVRYKIMQAAGELRCPGFAPSPVKLEYSPCDSCPYIPICRYGRLPASVAKKKNDDTIEEMRRQLGERGADPGEKGGGENE